MSSGEVKVASKFDNILLHFIRTPISRIHPRRANRTLPVWDSAVTVNATDTVPTVFQALIKENILSAPVLSSDGKCCGFVDMMDLVSFTVGLFNTPMDIELSEFFVRNRRFRETPVSDVMGLVSLGMVKSPFTVQKDFSMFYAFEMLARANQHRLAVVAGPSGSASKAGKSGIAEDSMEPEFIGGADQVVGVMTESMIIGFLFLNLEKMGDVRNIPVSDFISHYFVTSIRENEPAIKAFNIMTNRQLSGIAIVDAEGTLTDVISTRDLRGIGPEAEMFTRLWEPVKDFKNKSRAMFPGLMSQKPVCVTPSDTLETVIKLMETRSIHRVFVVQDRQNPKPINVISQSDVIKFLLPYSY